MSAQSSFLSTYELPRLAMLTPKLCAAAFPLMKLLPARHIVDTATRSGALKPDGQIVETTSGTFGLALALVCSVEKRRLTLISSPTLVDDAWRHRVEQLGSTVVLVDDPESNGNQSGRLAALNQILQDDRSAYWPCQYDNPEIASGYSRFAGRALSELGRIDCLIGTIGTGGSLCGTGRVLRIANPELKIVAVDTHRSALFGQPAGPRLLRGLGNSIIPKNVDHELIDEVHWVGALPAIRETRRLFRDHGLFIGPTSGAAALVAAWWATGNPDAKALVILPDEGYRYTGTVYNDEWVEALPGWKERQPEAPAMLKAPVPSAESDWTMMAWNRRKLESV